MANGIIKLKHAGERAFGSSTGAGSGIIVGEGFGGEAGLGGPGGGGSARFRQAGGGGLGGSEDEGDSRRGASKHMPMLMEESMKGGGRPVSAGMGDVAAAAAAALAIESGRDGFAALEGDEEENYGGPEEPKDSRGHKKPTGSKEAMGDHEARDGKGGAVFDSGQTTVTSPSTDGGQAEARTAGSNSSTNKDDRRSSEMSTDDVAGGGGSDHGDDCRGNDDDDDDNEEEKVKPVLTRKTLCPALEAELMHVAFKIFDLDNSGTVTKEVRFSFGRIPVCELRSVWIITIWFWILRLHLSRRGGYIDCFDVAVDQLRAISARLFATVQVGLGLRIV